MAADTQFVDLLANDEQTVTLDADYGSVEVVNLGTAPVYARTDGVVAVVAADGCEVVLPNGTLEIPVETDGDTEVSLITATAGTVGVKGGPSGRRSGAGLATTSVAGAVEVSNDAGNPLPVNGTVEVTNDVGNPLPVSGPVTDAQLRAAGVPVTGTVEVTNDVGNPLPVNGTVEVTNDVGNPLPVNGIVAVSGTKFETCVLSATGEFAPGVADAVFPTIAAKFVRFKARWANQGNVYVGKAGVTKLNGATDVTSGFELAAGELSAIIPTTNLDLMHGIADNAADSVAYEIYT